MKVDIALGMLYARGMSLAAIIPVRGGSQRVKNKNIRPFAGSTLLEIKIEQLKRIPGIDEIIVNTEDESMLGIAAKHGVTPVRRDPYYASSTVPIKEVYRDLALHCTADTVMMADATNPLIADATIARAIELYHGRDAQYDSLNTAHLVKEFLWLDGKALNYDPEHKPKSQDLPDIQSLNWAVNIIGRLEMIRLMDVTGRHPLVMDIGSLEGFDIDTEFDMMIAEMLYRKMYQA